MKYAPQAFAWPMAASLLCAPVVYPWYLLWLLPVRAFGFDSAAHHLDDQHSANFLRMAFAHAWRPVGSSWLDYAAGIRNGGSGCRLFSSFGGLQSPRSIERYASA